MGGAVEEGLCNGAVCESVALSTVPARGHSHLLSSERHYNVRLW